MTERTVQKSIIVNMGGLISLLVDRITMPAYDVVRELVTNEKDANAKRVLITWNAAKRTLTVEGWGHGIEDLGKFMEILTDAKRLQKLMNPNVKISGEMGIGRLSALRLADKVIFESNNKSTKSLKITFDRRQMEKQIDPEIKEDTDRRNAYLSHPGVRVTLVGVKREHHEDLAKAEKELSKIYAWSIIRKEFDIVWNDQTLKAPADIQKLFASHDYKIKQFETTQKTVDVTMLDERGERITKKVNVVIEGILEEFDNNKTDARMGIIPLYQNGIKICDLAQGYKCRGILNTGNSIKVSADRNGYDEYDAGGIVFKESLEKILEARFERIAEKEMESTQNKKTRKFNDWAGKKLGALIKVLPKKVAQMEGISETYKQQIEAHEKEEKWLLCREGKSYDTEITGIREATTEYGMRDEDGSIAIGGGGGRPGPNVGTRGGAIVTDNPQDGVLRVSQILQTSLEELKPEAKQFHVIKHIHRGQKKKATPNIDLIHTYELDPKVFTQYYEDKDVGPSILVGMRHPLHREMFDENKNYLPHKAELFLVWMVRSLLVKLPVPPTKVEDRDQVLDNLTATMLRAAKRDRQL